MDVTHFQLKHNEVYTSLEKK